MSLEKQDVEKIAQLARLAIDENDIPGYSDELSRILDLVEQMNAVNTDNVEPMAHPQDVSQRLRQDKETESNQRDEFQKIAPLVERGLFLVTKVID